MNSQGLAVGSRPFWCGRRWGAGAWGLGLCVKNTRGLFPGFMLTPGSTSWRIICFLGGFLEKGLAAEQVLGDSVPAITPDSAWGGRWRSRSNTKKGQERHTAERCCGLYEMASVPPKDWPDTGPTLLPRTH